MNKQLSKNYIFGGTSLPPPPGDPVANRVLKLYKKLHIDTIDSWYKYNFNSYNTWGMMSPGILLKTSKNDQF